MAEGERYGFESLSFIITETQPAGVPHTFVNRGPLVAVFPTKRLSYKELGPNPLVK